MAATTTQARPLPDMNIPKSNNTVKVSVIDSTTRLKIPNKTFFQPQYTGYTYLKCPAFSFLIEHAGHKPILFDLGVRYDWQRLPSFPRWRANSWGIMVEKDVATILKDEGVDVDSGAIETIIWSHHHWDHTGDPSLFPSSTGLVVGPGFKKQYLPPYPGNKDSPILDTDVEGRDVREIDFAKEGNGLKIGRFNAYDYFGDGSFYLLDTPGHSVGHMCGLARTTADTFIFMGGDSAHHGGEFRPTEYMPLPTEINPSPVTQYTNICPGHFFEDIHPHEKASSPFFEPTATLSHDKDAATWTIAGLGEFDCHENILLLLAHDGSVVDPNQFDFFPKQLTDWHEKGIAKKVKWLWLSDLSEAADVKKKGGEPYKWDKTV